MALVVLNDVCDLPNKKRKAEGDLVRAVSVAKSHSSSSLASSRSDTPSKVSEESAASSNCSFKPVVRQPSEPSARVRIAIGGA